MGIDWEGILDAEGADLQDAYDDHVALAQSYDDDDKARRKDEESRAANEALARSWNLKQPTPEPKERERFAFREGDDMPPFLNEGDIVIGKDDPVPEGCRLANQLPFFAYDHDPAERPST